MAYQLLHTNVALTGNVKLCCYITNREIERASLNPLTTSEAIIPHEINLKNSTYSRDLVSFYSDYKGIFYDNIVNPRLLKSGEFKKVIDADEFETGYVTDYSYGAKRVSYQKNGKQIAILAPVFINNEKELPSNVKIEFKDSDENVIYTFILGLEGTELGKYLHRSYKDVGGENDSCRSIFVDTSKYTQGIGYSTLRGWSVVSGEITNTTSNLPQKLFSRDITHTEFDSYIGEEFRTYKTVFPYILNLCWYFNIEDLASVRGMNLEYGDIFTINATYLDASGVELSLKDIDFNHYNIKALGKKKNLLDYTHEQDTAELRDNFKEHLAPTICRWSLVESDNSYIFNNYIGYDKFNTGITYSFIGTSEEPSRNDNNLSWFNYLLEDIDPSRRDRTHIQSGVYALEGGNINTFYNDLVFGFSGYTGIRNIYYSNSANLRQYRLHESDDKLSTICNGIKLNIDPWKLPKNEIIEPGKNYTYKYNESTRISFSLLDNYTDIKPNSTSKLSDLEPCIVVVVEPNWKTFTEDSVEIEISSLNYIVWVPFKIDSNNVYDLIEGDTVSATQKREFFKKLTIDKIFNQGVEFNSRLFEVQSNGDWVRHSVNTGSTKIGEIATVSNPIFTRPIKLLHYTLDNEEKYNLFQNNLKSNIILGRYYGWIQPHFVSISESPNDESIIDNNYLFRRIIQGERDDRPNMIEEWGDGIEVIDLNIFQNGRNVIDTYPYSTPEGKFFRASRIAYTPAEITVNISSEEKNKTNEQVKREILESIFSEEDAVYLADQYSASYDISKDKDYYIVNLRLK